MLARPFAVAVLVILSFASITQAQPLADRVPEDAMLYIAWRGSESMGSGFAQSHYKAVLDASNVQAVFDETIPALVRRFSQDNPGAKDMFSMIAAIGGPTMRHSTAIYFGGLDLTTPDQPMPKFAILCDAGADAPALVTKVNEILEQTNSPLPLTVTNYNGLVAMTTGRYEEFDALLGGPAGVAPTPALAKNAAFQAALKSSHADPEIVFYIHSESAMKLVDLAVSGDANAARLWPIIKESAGVGGIKQIIYAGGFDQKDWRDAMFIAAPAPRKGMVASLFDHQPLTPDALAAVPKSATFFAGGRFDPATFYTSLHQIARDIDPYVAANFDGAMNQVKQGVGIDVQKDFLEPLGSEWMLYSAPDIAGNGFLGICLVNRLDDPDKFSKSLTSIEQLANQIIAQQSQQAEMTIKMRQADYDGLTIHWLGVPFVAPAWAVKDGNLYVGLYPQVVAAAAQHVTSKGPSILQNEKYVAVQKRLGDKRASAVSFMDLPATAGDGYQTMMMVAQTLMGLADIYGVDSPPMVLPPLHKLLPHIVPAGGVTWADDAGIHMQSLRPFPGAEMIGSEQNLLIAQQATAVSILLPSLNRARETANRVKCASNLRQIGQAMLLYANENRGKNAPDFGTLLKTQDITWEVFICPSTGTALPNGAAMDVAQRAAWVNENSDYVYLGAGTTATYPAEYIMVHEKLDNHAGDGINMLYGDGHVDFMVRDRAEELITKQKANPQPAL